MIDEPYMTKEDKQSYKTKQYSVAISPSGNQYAIADKDPKQFLETHGIKGIKAAKDAGWLLR